MLLRRSGPRKKFDDIFSSLYTIHERDGQTDRQTDRRLLFSMAACVNYRHEHKRLNFTRYRNVSTRLRSDEIFNDQLISQSLLTSRVKKCENRSTVADVMGN